MPWSGSPTVIKQLGCRAQAAVRGWRVRRRVAAARASARADADADSEPGWGSDCDADPGRWLPAAWGRGPSRAGDAGVPAWLSSAEPVGPGGGCGPGPAGELAGDPPARTEVQPDGHSVEGVSAWPSTAEPDRGSQRGPGGGDDRAGEEPERPVSLAAGEQSEGRGPQHGAEGPGQTAGMGTRGAAGAGVASEGGGAALETSSTADQGVARGIRHKVIRP